MGEEKKTAFGAFLAFAGRHVEGTKYEFRIHPTEERWVTVDMTKIPGNVKTKKNPKGIEWEEVEIDAGDAESATRLIGWSRTDGFTGVIYLSDNYMDKHKLAVPPPGAGDRGNDYEFMAILHRREDSAQPSISRFYGFHAQITKTNEDGKVLVSAYHAGTSKQKEAVPGSTFWVDFTDKHYDFNHASSISKERKEGALFTERDRVTIRGLKLMFPSSVLHVGKGDNPVLHATLEGRDP